MAPFFHLEVANSGNITKNDKNQCKSVENIQCGEENSVYFDTFFTLLNMLK